MTKSPGARRNSSHEASGHCDANTQNIFYFSKLSGSNLNSFDCKRLWHDFSFTYLMNEKFSKRMELGFENLVGMALKIYGHPFTFIIAFIVVIFFLIQSFIHYSGFRDCVRDVILSISFLSFFIIQRAFNKTNTSIQIKINELIHAHDNARNELISIDEKTGTELDKLKEIHKPGTDAIDQDTLIKK